MASCTYTYHNHTFTSELELDTYLLEKDKFFKQFKDIVFSLDTPALDQASKLDKAIKDNQTLYDDYIDKRRKGLLKYDSDGDFYFDTDIEGNILRHIGVNKFLSKQHKDGNHQNKLLFPYFDKDNYFKGSVGHEGRYDYWLRGEFNDDELEEFFDPGETPTPILQSDLESKRDLILERWNAKGRQGEAVHKIFELFFSNDDNNQPVRQLKEAELYNYISSKLPTELVKYLEYNGDPQNNIRSAIAVAQNLYSQIKAQTKCSDDELLFYPEYLLKGIATDTNNGKAMNLWGIADLIVIDKSGKLHLFDYKTSTKTYDKFDSAKRRGYSYQLAMYKQMLENFGLRVSGMDLNIIPIKINDFQKQSNGHQFNSITSDGIKPITNEPETVIAYDQLERYIMPSKFTSSMSVTDLHKNRTEFSSKCWKDIDIGKTFTAESVEKFLTKGGYFDNTNDQGEYEYSYNTLTGGRKTIKGSDRADLVQKVLQLKQSIATSNIDLTNRCKEELKKCIEAEDPNAGNFPRTFNKRKDSASWLQDTLSIYCNKEWQIQEMPELEQYGTIVLYNKNTRQKDFITISSNSLHDNYHDHLKDSGDPRKGRKNILSSFETDAQSEQRHKRLILEGTKGNIELLETMMSINCLSGMEDYIVGNIKVINPYDSQMVTASNEQLLVNFNALCEYADMQNINNFDKGNIKLAKHFDLLANQLDEIWTRQEALSDNGWRGEYYKFKELNSCKSVIDACRNGSVDEKIAAVWSLIQEMQQKMNDLYVDTSELKRLNSERMRVYNQALFTFAELKGIHFRQQLDDHSQWFSSVFKMFKEGLSGNMIDNPGNLDSETLNLVTVLIKEAYQNTRQEMQTEKAKLDKIINKLKQDIGFNYLKENVGFNQADLYAPLYRTVIVDGVKDLWFKRVEDVDPIYRPLLEYMLTSINKRRLNVSANQIQQLIDSDSPKYYQVPLCQGSFDSVASSKGLMSAFRDKLRYLNPINWKDTYDEAYRSIQGLGYAEKRATNRQSEELIYRMENMFDRGESDNRQKAIQDAKGNRGDNVDGIDYIERNAETLLLKHAFAFSQQRNIDNIFPLIQASMAHLSIQGANAGQQFTNDKSYLDKYIRNKVKNESIVDPNFEGAAKVVGVMKQAASKLTLAFTPVQLFYQPLQGLWTDIRLALQNHDGKSFNFTHFKNSIKLLAGELFNFSGKPTIISKLNELYSLNDMDINKYIDNITHNKKGFLYNASNMMYKFASRPDYYNRLALFLSQMQGDGCLDAHSIVNGELVYDWTKDKRFSKFAADPKNNSTDPEYQKQKSLYYAVAKQFVNEGATYSDGSSFILDMNNPMPLPRAYTSKQAESNKSIADDIYGYYTNENKSLIQSTAFGSMWLQFKTFWSGKKNQYLQSGGIRMRGSWEPYQEIIRGSDGKPTGQIIKYYYALDENGEVDYNKIVREDELPENQRIAPVITWKGQWQEGIAVSLATIMKDRHILQNYRNLKDIDPDRAKVYRSNMIQLAYDLCLWLIGGALIGGALSEWLKDLLDENKDNDDFLTGCSLAAANVAVRTIKNSFIDFNIFDSLGSPLTNWTPFAFQFARNNIKNLSEFAVGNRDLWDTIVNTNGATRQIKPIFDALKPEEFRTIREGGTWQTAAAREKQGSTGGGGASGSW